MHHYKTAQLNTLSTYPPMGPLFMPLPMPPPMPPPIPLLAPPMPPLKYYSVGEHVRKEFSRITLKFEKMTANEAFNKLRQKDWLHSLSTQVINQASSTHTVSRTEMPTSLPQDGQATVQTQFSQHLLVNSTQKSYCCMRKTCKQSTAGQSTT